MPVNDGRWTLDNLSQLALAINPILPRAEARLQSDRAAAWQAGVWPNPRFETNNPQVIASGPSKNRYSAGFMQDIPAGRKRLDRAAGLQTVREDAYQALSDRYDVLTSVRRTFYAVLAQQERVAVLRQLVVIAAETRDVAQRRYETKQAAEIDVLTLDIELRQAQTALEQAEALLIARRRQLAAAVGAPDLPITEVHGELAGLPPRFDEDTVRAFVAQRSADVLRARTEVTRSAILQRRAEIEPYFQGVTTGPAAAWFERPSANTPTQFWYNIRFNIPVLDRNQGNIGAARAYTRDAAASVRVTQNSLLGEAADALSRHRAALQRSQRIGQAILPTARRTQTLVNRGYRSGLFDVTRVLQAQRALFEANRDYIDALEEVWYTAAELGNLLQLEAFP